MGILIEIECMKRISLYFLALCLLMSCAISRKVEYEGIYANVPAFKQKIAIATWDQREQVLTGARNPDFVGYTRSGAGIAYPMGTESGKPFADIASVDISSSLSAKGSTTKIVMTQSSTQESKIIEQLKKTKSKKLILIDCRQFHTDGYGATSLMYNLQVTIYSEDGSNLKQKTFNGKKPL